MIILAIETSCDETAITLAQAQGSSTRPDLKIIKEIVASQIKIHAPFGGVVPMLAKREHIKNLPILYRKIFANDKDQIPNDKQISNIKSQKNKKENPPTPNHPPARQAVGVAGRPITIDDVDLIAVTVGPGLEPALWTGIEFAKELSKKYKKPLIGVNHLHGHLYSFLLSKKTINQKDKLKNKKNNLKFEIKNLKFPAVSLLVSGGHTELALLKNVHTYKKLGETMDDAVGESFDKVARILNLPYPGGPAIEQLAKKGDKNSIPFPSPMITSNNYNFSYSGLKTAVLYYVKDHAKKHTPYKKGAKLWEMGKYDLTEKEKANIAASFQKAAFDALVKKTIRAAQEYGAKSITIGGGVAANKELTRMLKVAIKKEKFAPKAHQPRAGELKINLIVPPFAYCMDNATMIALAAYIQKDRKRKYPLRANGMMDL